MAIELVGFPTTLGMPRQAYRHGPEALRACGLVGKLDAAGLRVTDLGDLPVDEGQFADPAGLRVQKVVDAARRQSDFWLARHQPENLMLTLGGDHSASLGTIWALRQMGHEFDIVWIDAHGDFNVIDTSPSGNPHGMVLALACGLMPAFMPQLIHPCHLRLWGIRDLDAGERQLLIGHRVESLTPEQVRQNRTHLIDRLRPDVLLSFDIDSVEPAEAPATMTPAPGGFSRGEVLELVAELSQKRRLLAVDIVEYHPDRDQESLTLDLAMKVAEAALTRQAKAAQ